MIHGRSRAHRAAAGLRVRGAGGVRSPVDVEAAGAEAAVSAARSSSEVPGSSGRYGSSMFTGLIREVGRVAARDGGPNGVRLTIEAPATARDAAIGDSVSIDGVCLTVVACDDSTLAFEAVPETLARSSLATLEPGSRVNLEPALRAGEPLGGHYVQGHVDGVASVRSAVPEGDGSRIWFDVAPGVLRYVVEKGSVAVQGTSLTVADLDDAGFAVALIPHTLEATTLGALEPGGRVNIEVDVLAKYVEKLLPR